ncbi:MAG: helix-turn-helix transcriptional regulator [Chloroflexota bacterium]|nr:helix-turn-helix transcriptional regulator [Chloroflexota bacterium]
MTEAANNLTFGQLIHQTRVEQKLKLQDVAARTSVDVSTISRIERDVTQATLQSAILLCRALGVDPVRLWCSLHGDVESYRPTYHSHEEVLLESDVLGLGRLFYSNHEQCIDLVATLLNTIVVEQPASPLYGNHMPTLTRDDVEMLFIQSPVIKLTVEYPPELMAKDVLNMYAVGGVVAGPDASMFVRKLHIKALHRTDAKQVIRALTTLQIAEGDRIKLADILSLDKQLKGEGEIFAMCWIVYLYRLLKVYGNVEHAVGPSLYQERRADEHLLHVFVNICRWLQYQHKDDTCWLHSIRQSIGSSS